MKLKGLLKVALVLLAVSSLFVACDTIAGGRFPHVEKVYMKPGEDWASDNPVYAAWMWTDGKEGSWTELTKSTIEEDLWEVAVPSEIDNIIFVKMKDGTTKDKFSWDTKEEQTDDLKVPYVFDNVQVYSIKAKEWIAIGAKEPEVPVLEPVAVSAAEFANITWVSGDVMGWNEGKGKELEADKSFTFYANDTKTAFKYTDGTWDFCLATSEKIKELGKEYPITEKGTTGNIEIAKGTLTEFSEYKVTLTRKDDGFAYVKVVATGGTQPLDKLTPEELTKVTYIAGTMTGNDWPHEKLNNNTKLFSANGSDAFLITSGSWDSGNIKLGSAEIEKLGEEYPLYKNGANITFKEGVLTKDKNYEITVVVKDSVVYVKVDATEKEIPDPFKGKTISYAGTMTVVDSAWTHIALGETKSFDFYANGVDDAFKFTAGNWTDVQAGSATINALNTKVELKTGTSGIGNITFASGVLTRNSGYKATYTFENGKAYVTVTATGTTNPDPLPDLEPFVPVSGKVYLQPGSDWTSANQVFAAYFYGDGDVMVKMTETTQKGMFECTVPTGKNYTSIIFVRCDASKGDPSWDSKWNQTGDLELKQGPDNYYVTTDWDTGEWKTF